MHKLVKSFCLTLLGFALVGAFGWGIHAVASLFPMPTALVLIIAPVFCVFWFVIYMDLKWYE